MLNLFLGFTSFLSYFAFNSLLFKNMFILLQQLFIQPSFCIFSFISKIVYLHQTLSALPGVPA